MQTQTLTVLKNGPNKSVKFYTNKSGRDFYLTNDGKVQMYDGYKHSEQYHEPELYKRELIKKQTEANEVYKEGRA